MLSKSCCFFPDGAMPCIRDARELHQELASVHLTAEELALESQDRSSVSM